MKKNFLHIIYALIMAVLLFIIIWLSVSGAISEEKYRRLQELSINYEIPKDDLEVTFESVTEKESEENREDIQEPMETTEPVEEPEFASETAPPSSQPYISEQSKSPKVVTIPSTEIDPENYTPSLSINYDDLKAQNPDYIGWINIPGMTISYPVVQTTNNSYYLRRSFDGTDATAGTIFEDAYCVNGIYQKNMILYGHNMRNGSMFGTLKKYKTTSFFNSHRYIEFYVKNEVFLYKIFAVREVPADINSLNYQVDDFEFEDYIANAKTKAYQFAEPEITGQILTLSTCVGDYSRRLLINAVKIN